MRKWIWMIVFFYTGFVATGCGLKGFENLLANDAEVADDGSGSQSTSQQSDGDGEALDDGTTQPATGG